jgi:hypothetical protein
LLVVASILDARHKVVDALALNDPVEHNLVALGREERERGGVPHLGDPLHVANLEHAHDGPHAEPAQLVLEVVSVVSRADLAVVEEELDRVGAWREAYGVKSGSSTAGCGGGAARSAGRLG